MTLLKDKFNIIENNVKNVNREDLSAMIDNYFENLLHSDEKLIHPELISQILNFRDDIDFSKNIKNQLENYLKEKKTNIRNNIKRGSFSINDLIKLINNYNQKINKFSSLTSNKELIVKVSLLQLFEEIISEPSIIKMLSNELSEIKEENNKLSFDLINTIKKISEYNPNLKAYSWFLVLISSSLKETTDIIIEKTYPIPVYQEKLTNTVMTLQFLEKIVNQYNHLKEDLNQVLSGSITSFSFLLDELFKACDINQLTGLFKNNLKVIEKIFNINNLKIKETLTKLLIEYIDSNFVQTKTDDLNKLGKLIEFYKQIENLLNKNSNKEIIDKKISSLISDESIFDKIIEHINKDKCHNILMYCSNIKNKDKFVDKYNQKLILRIMNNLNMEQVNNEKEVLKLLEDKMGQKLLFKTKKIIYDTEQTINDFNNFSNLSEPEDWMKNSNIITTSYGNWDVVHEGILDINETNFNSNMMNLLKMYDIFYNKRYENRRKLCWLPHYGEITFLYNNNEYKMMPIQFMILEYLQKNKINKNVLLEIDILKNYNHQFRKSVIASLISGGIIKNDKDMLILNSESTVKNYIEFFFNTSNYGNIWEEKRQLEFVHTREDILMANINHLIKINSIKKEVLFDKLKEIINVFDVEEEMFNKILDKMKERDYLKIENGDIEKLFY